MKKRKILSYTIFACSLLILLLAACDSSGKSSPQVKFAVPEDLNHPEYTIGVPQGAAAMTVGESFFDKAKIQYYNSLAEAYTAIQYGKLDAFVFDRHTMEYMVKANSSLALLPDDIGEEHIVIGLPFKNKELRDEVNSFIAQYRADGTYNDMYDRWFSGNPPQMPDIPKPDKIIRRLKVATEGLNEPMNFYGKDGVLTGFDVEFIKRLALYLNAEIELTTMTFDGLIPAVESGKIDLLVANLNGTKEFREIMLVSDDYVDSAICVMINKDRLSGKKHTENITEFSQLNNRKVGVLTGTVTDELGRKNFQGSEIVYLNTFNEMVLSLETRKVDAFLMEEPQARIMFQTKPNMRALKRQLTFDDYAFVFSKNEKELCDAFSVEILKMKEDGSLKKLEGKWFSGDEESQTMPQKLENPPNGVIRFATVPQCEPFSFLRNGEVVGFDIEVALLAANNLGYALEPVIMEWGGYLESIVSGKVKFGAGCTTVTEERKKKVHFAESNYKGGIVVVVRNEQLAENKTLEAEKIEKSTSSLKASFERTFIREDRWKLILNGLKVTVLITVLAAVAGTLLAFGICAMRRSKKKFVSMLARIYIALMQGTPMLVILMILYYIIFAKIDIDAIIVAVIGFALNFAAYTAEMFRSGIDGIQKGQSEAASALGLSRFQSFRKVIFPQVLRTILPIYKGEFINMLKMTSIVGYIAIQDLTKMSDIIRSRTYEAFFPLIATAIIYFAAAQLLALGLSYIEFKLEPENRRPRSTRN